MISVTLNSKKGNNLAVYPDSQISTFVLTNPLANGASILILQQPNNSLYIGDKFTWNNVTHTITNYNSLTNYWFAPPLNLAVPNFTTLYIISSNSSSLGYKIMAGTPSASLSMGLSLVSFYNSSLLNSLNIVAPYMSLSIGTDTYSMSNITYSALNNINMISVKPPLKTNLGYATTPMTIYAQTYSNISYNIDPSIFEDGKKYELSFSFSSYACIISQSCQPASVYINLGRNNTYETDSNSIISSNLLGYLKPNFIHSNMSSALTVYGNVSFSTLVADPSNQPILIAKPSNSNITVTILNDDLTPFTDNSDIGLCPAYEMTLHFKEVKE